MRYLFLFIFFWSSISNLLGQHYERKVNKYTHTLVCTIEGDTLEGLGRITFFRKKKILKFKDQATLKKKTFRQKQVRSFRMYTQRRRKIYTNVYRFVKIKRFKRPRILNQLIIGDKIDLYSAIKSKKQYSPLTLSATNLSTSPLVGKVTHYLKRKEDRLALEIKLNVFENTKKKLSGYFYDCPVLLKQIEEEPLSLLYAVFLYTLTKEFNKDNCR